MRVFHSVKNKQKKFFSLAFCKLFHLTDCGILEVISNSNVALMSFCFAHFVKHNFVAKHKSNAFFLCKSNQVFIVVNTFLHFKLGYCNATFYRLFNGIFAFNNHNKLPFPPRIFFFASTL